MVLGKLAVDLDPLNPFIQNLYIVVLYTAGQYQLAYDYLEKVLITNPGEYFASSGMELMLAVQEDSLGSIEAGLQWLPLEEESKTTVKQIFNEQGYFAAQKEIINALEEYSRENYFTPLEMASRYIWILNNIEKGIDWLEKGYEMHDQQMPYIYIVFRENELIKNNPRHIALLKKMNLPVD